MTKLFVLICLLIQPAYDCDCDGTGFVRLRITQGEPSTEGIRCVLKSMNKSHTTFGIRDGNGECVILNQSWEANKTYYPGYTYLEKDKAAYQMVFESFIFPDMIGEPNPLREAERVWTIPGTFGVGGRLELFFTTGLTDWSSVRFRFFDLPAGSSFSIEELSGLVLVSVHISRQEGYVKFQTYSEGWGSVPLWTPFPFEDDSTYKMTMVAQQDGFQILFDGIERALLPYVGAPEIMRTMVIRGFKNYDVIINNITFYGV